MITAASPGGTPRTIALAVEPLSPAAFAPFGQVIEPGEDGAPFDDADAQLEFGAGRPRFYIMRLPPRALTFGSITRHRAVTQCLAAAGGASWLLAVAPPGAAHEAKPPLDAIRAFAVAGTCGVKLHRGTWHAGPYFEGRPLDFFNLELADTNVADHESCDLAATYGVTLQFRT